jgi:hypothetical protein
MGDLLILKPNIFLVFPFFLFNVFFWKKLFFILYTWNIYYSKLSLFIPFFLFLSSFFCDFLKFFLFFFTLFLFWKILMLLRKYCFNVAIATLFYFSTTLKMSLKSYMSFINGYNFHYILLYVSINFLINKNIFYSLSKNILIMPQH